MSVFVSAADDGGVVVGVELKVDVMQPLARELNEAWCTQQSVEWRGGRWLVVDGAIARLGSGGVWETFKLVPAPGGVSS